MWNNKKTAPHFVKLAMRCEDVSLVLSCYVLGVLHLEYEPRGPTPTQEYLIAVRHSSLPSVSAFISEALLSYMPLLRVSIKVTSGLPLVLLPWDVSQRISSPAVSSGAAHNARLVPFFSVLSSLTVWVGCHTGRYFSCQGLSRRHWAPLWASAYRLLLVRAVNARLTNPLSF